MGTIVRESGLPGFLAPRLAFEFFEERVAEETILSEDRVYLGASWFWVQPYQALVNAPLWVTPKMVAAHELEHQAHAGAPHEDYKESVLDAWLDRLAEKFVEMKLS